MLIMQVRSNHALVNKVLNWPFGLYILTKYPNKPL